MPNSIPSVLARNSVEGVKSMTVVANASPRVEVRSDALYFYFYMSLACAAVAFLGFAPTYFVPLASRKFNANAVVHIHGLLFFSWTLYFIFQPWLAASGRIVRHRALGLIGVSFATAMTIFGTLVAVNFMKTAASHGAAEGGIALAIVPLTGIAFFAIVFTWAVAAVRRPEIHKRLMLLAAISLLDAAVARWFLTFLAPSPGPAGTSTASAVGLPPVSVTVAPAMVAYLLLVVAMIFDWRTRGRPHTVYVLGGAVLVLIEVLNVPLSETHAWHSFAGGILALAQ
jgi:hypothetical protein